MAYTIEQLTVRTLTLLDGGYSDSLTAGTQATAEHNALIIYPYLKNLGWTNEAIAGALGNMWAESHIMAATWQGWTQPDDEYNDDYDAPIGYSLTQWTNFHKFTDWCFDRGLDARTLNSALERIKWEYENNQQWYTKSQNNYTTWEQFIKLTDVNFAAQVWAQNYEVPDGWNTQELINYRQGLARQWYEFITGTTPPEPPTPHPPYIPKKGNKLIYYLRSRKLKAR